MNNPETSTIEWLQPWVPIVDQALQTRLENEVQREVGQGHVLFRRSAKAIAHRNDQDDVLFVVENPASSQSFTELRRETRSVPMAHTTLFDDVAAALEGRMKSDHAEYTGAG